MSRPLRRWDILFAQMLSRMMRNPRTKFDEREFVKGGETYLLNYVSKNAGSIDENRRNFLKGLVIGVGAATVAGFIPGLSSLIPPNVGLTSFPKIILLASNGKPITASSIPVNEPIITVFLYPLQNEPNFLVNLGDENNNPVEIKPTTVTVPANGQKYKFPGGVGPYNSIVAYSAICQHLGCQPPEIHFYPPQYMKLGMAPPSSLTSQALQAATSANAPGVIHCDCHGSTYDPYHGASVLTGPTVRPLPFVLLEWDEKTDYLYAIGEGGVPVYGHVSDLTGGTPLSYDYTTVTQEVNPF
ncbi:Rieske iron-sulfur protein SoxL2 [Sulfolobales archaeon HS-7]|nr:Rieske iron-sulfur protein SoxL2 [Sulfolobales archaeon HS-7]